MPLTVGWSSSQGAFQTGDPEYAVRGPIVYLAGSMNSGASGRFMTMPTAIQPTTGNKLERQVYTWAGTTGDLILSPPTGGVLSIATTYAQQFTSLAGIQYPRNS